jgi:uncharacterized protein YfiM (DUF2279 family)
MGCFYKKWQFSGKILDIYFHLLKGIEMKRKVFFSALFLSAISFFSDVRAEDRWLGKDKIQHAALSAAFSASARQFVSTDSDAILLTMVPGILKEVMDYQDRSRHTPSIKDLAADLAGAYVGLKIRNCIITNRSAMCSWSF